jgi:hypothetical protein
VKGEAGSGRVGNCTGPAGSCWFLLVPAGSWGRFSQSWQAVVAAAGAGLTWGTSGSCCSLATTCWQKAGRGPRSWAEATDRVCRASGWGM